MGHRFGGQAIAQALPQQVQLQVTNQMVDMLAGYFDKIAAAATTTGQGTDMADLASMAILVDTNASQAKELKKTREHIYAFRNNNPQADKSGPKRTLCPHYTAVRRNVPHAKNACFFNPDIVQDSLCNKSSV